MSIKLMSQVWDCAPYHGQRLIILLALADSANDDGYCYPSIRKLTDKARCHEDTLRRHMTALERDGWVFRELRPGHASLYRVTIVDHPGAAAPAAPTPPQPAEYSATRRGVNTATPPQRAEYSIAHTPPQPAEDTPPQRAEGVPRNAQRESPATRRGITVTEPSVNRQENRHARARAETPPSEKIFTDGALALAVVEPAADAATAPTPLPPPPPPPLSDAPPVAPSAPSAPILFDRAVAYTAWERAKLRIVRAEGITTAMMDSWIRPLKIVSLMRADGRYVLTLAAPGSAVAQQAAARFGGLIATAVGSCLNCLSVDLSIINAKDARDARVADQEAMS